MGGLASSRVGDGNGDSDASTAKPSSPPQRPELDFGLLALLGEVAMSVRSSGPYLKVEWRGGDQI